MVKTVLEQRMILIYMKFNQIQNLTIFRLALLLLILVFVSNNLNAQDLSYRKIDFTTILDSFTVKEFNKKIYEATISGKIKAYKTDSLMRLYSLEELELAGASEKIVQLKVPPEYPDYVIDSVIIIPFNIEKFAGNFISEKWILIAEEYFFTSNFHAFAITYERLFNGTALGEHAVFWIDLEELEKVFDSNEIQRFSTALFKESQKYYSKSIESLQPIKLDLRKYTGEYTIHELNNKLYRAAISEHIEVYQSEKLDVAIPKDKIIQGMISHEIEETCPDPDYPDYCYGYTTSSLYNSERISLN